MADKVVALNASDLFSLGGNFNAQSSSSITNEGMANILDANGNNECETGGLNTTTEHTVSYAYCNATPDIDTDLGTFLTQFGDVQNSILVTELTINFAAGQYATVDITGHNHAENAHAAGLSIGYADVSAAVPDGAGFGVPTLAGVDLGTPSVADYTSATITFRMNHVDSEGSGGNHFAGKNITPRGEITVEFLGVPDTAQPITGWTTDSYGPGDANGAFDTYSVTAHRFFDLAT